MTSTIDLTRPELRYVGAFKLAMRELGVPEHPDGQCPDWDCNCRELQPALVARVTELLTDPDIGDAEVCHDCLVLLPFPGALVYAIDSASVCRSCAGRRYGDQAGEYRIV
jgi:hypothetical protein